MVFAGLYLADLSFSYIDILVAEETTGFLAVSERDQLTAGYELNFVELQRRYILVIALGLGLVLIVMLIAMPLGVDFVTPIKRLTAAMSKLTSIDYQHRIDLNRKDEFSQLSFDFNELAAILEQNGQARKRFLADISTSCAHPLPYLKRKWRCCLMVLGHCR